MKELTESKIFNLVIPWVACCIIGYFLFNQSTQPTIIYNHNCKEDSLQNVINNLQAELQMSEDGWDKKENRYEDILFEYEYGLDHLKKNYPSAYREFHRIIGFRERYSKQVEKENKIRLQPLNNEYNR